MSRALHVGLVVHSLNHNNIGRVYPFLRAFVGDPLVQLRLAGWDETGALFPLLADLPWPIARLRGARVGASAEHALASALAGCDLLHCFKNRDHLPTALAVARARHIPLLLDLDDWELGLYLEGVSRWPRWRQALTGLSIARRVAEALELERLARTAPAAITVNSTALQAYFGGVITYTAADADAFDPRRSDGLAFRRAHAIPDDAPVLGFLGTPHPHKGIDELLAAFAEVRRHDPAAQLLVVGVPPHNPYRARLLATEGAVVIGYIAADAYPAAYAACDVVVIPQLAVTEGVVQTPAKLILAMAAGRPIVATAVGDMPAILSDTGSLTPPGDQRALAAAIIALLNDPSHRAALGAAARERFLARFTLARLRDQLATIYRCPPSFEK